MSGGVPSPPTVFSCAYFRNSFALPASTFAGATVPSTALGFPRLPLLACALCWPWPLFVDHGVAQCQEFSHRTCALQRSPLAMVCQHCSSRFFQTMQAAALRLCLQVCTCWLFLEPPHSNFCSRRRATYQEFGANSARRSHPIYEEQ